MNHSGGEVIVRLAAKDDATRLREMLKLRMAPFLPREESTVFIDQPNDLARLMSKEYRRYHVPAISVRSVSLKRRRGPGDSNRRDD